MSALSALRTALAALALTGLLWAAGPVQAQTAEQPTAPGDFRNGQDNDFGSIAMVPYLSAGDGSAPVEASIVVRDLDAIEAAADVLFAFNVKGDAVRATLDSVRTADGRVLVPVRTGTVDDGRQPQAHFAPADLLAAAKDGRLDVVLSGRVEAKADSQSHVGAMVIAFDEAWGTLPSGDGPAQLYGFTMVSATGVGGGVMPFQGQGNTWAVLPLALLAFVVAVAGATAVSALARTSAQATPSAAAPPAASARSTLAAVPTFGQAAAPPAPPARSAPDSPGRPVVAAATATAIPVFGGPVAPQAGRPVAQGSPRPPPATTGGAPAVPSPSAPKPLQGPLLPPGPLDRSSPAVGRATASTASPAVAEAVEVVPAKGAAVARPTEGGKPGAKPARVPALTATKRPKAKPAPKAGPSASTSKRKPTAAQRKRAA